ncbi:MAG: DUF3073 domain-containing protein [Frankiales bacterium]|nr:DUF3073 domain-containing protein [Frankiales bacterium]
MGRGRAKAKQTKVARDLKYSSGSLDPERLKADLARSAPPSTTSSVVDDDEGDDDPYAPPDVPKAR